MYNWNFLDQLRLHYKFYGRDMWGIYLFMFASCEPLNVFVVLNPNMAMKISILKIFVKCNKILMCCWLLAFARVHFHVLHIIYRGCQCDVRVRTRWRLSLLLPWLLCWRATAELHSASCLAHGWVCDVGRMSLRTRVL